MNKIRLTIRRKLFVALLSIAITSIFITTSINYITARDNLKKQVLTTFTLVAETKEGHLYEFLEGLRGRTVDFASDGYIRDSTEKIITSDTLYNSTDLNVHLRKNKMSLDPTISGINIFDSGGRVVASTHASEIGLSEPDEDYINKATRLSYGETYLSDVYVSHHFNLAEPIFSVSAPLMSRDEYERLGVLVIYIKTDKLNDVMTGRRQSMFGALTGEMGRGESLDAYLVNSESLIITAPRFEKATVLSQGVQTHPIAMCAQAQEGAATYVNYRNMPVVGSWMCFENGWTLVVEQNQTEAFHVLRQLQTDAVVTAVILTIIVFALSMLIARNFADPIKKLSETAKKIGEGDLSQRIILKDTDEIGQLAASINIMTAKLAGLYADLKKDTQILAHEKAQDDAILTSIGDGLIVIDRNQKILMVNKVFETLLGWRSSEVIGKKIVDIVRKEDENGQVIPLKDRLFYKALNQDAQFMTKSIAPALYYVRKDGSRFPVATTATPITMRGNSIGVVEVLRDITKEKSIDKAKTEFVSLTSHQLRTPLSKIRWYVELLIKSKQKTSTKDNSYLEGIDRANRYMIDLVNQLLNISRLELGTLYIEPKTVVVKDIIEDAIKEFMPEVEKRKIKLYKEYQNIQQQLQCDPKLLHIIFSNIIGNAVKYSSSGGAIRIAFRSDRDNIIFEVQDNGCGIPPEAQKRLFTKFFRADNAVSVTSEGSGLGLYIVKLLLDKMGGSISFQSPVESGSGTKFTLLIPINFTQNVEKS